jgi:hypothetical protein
MHLFSVSRKTFILLSSLVILLSIPVTTYLVQQNQDIRKQAKTFLNVPINGTFVDLPYGTYDMPASSMSAFMDELRNLKMNTIVINYIQYKPETSGCSVSNFLWTDHMPNILHTIMNTARERNISVYVGLVRTSIGCSDAQESQDNVNSLTNYLNDFQNTQNPIKFMIDNFSDYNNFTGWYLPDEPQFPWQRPANSQTSINFYKNQVNAIRSVSNKPILVSPGLIGTSYTTPNEMANLASNFKNETGIDIFVWQDSVGEVAANIGWRDEPTIYDYFLALSNLVGKNHLWVDHEFGNCCVAPTYSWGTNLTKPASIARINKQIQLVPLTIVNKRVIWIQQHHMGTIAQRRFEGSHRLKAAYQALYLNQGEYVKPVSYSFISPTHESFPDSGNEPFNLISGDPGHPFDTSHNPIFDPEWLGVVGSVEIDMNLGEIKNIDWVAIHLLKHAASSIEFPTKLEVHCSLDGINWPIKRGPWNLPLPYGTEDGEYVFSNPNNSPLNIDCRFLKLKLTPKASWFFTFLSEIEIIDAPPPPPTDTPTPTNTPTSTPTPTQKPTSVPTSPPTDVPTEPPVTIPDVAGDGDGDGVVNIDDYVIWLNNYQEVLGGNNNGDYYPDDFIDGLDYIIWLNNYGT